MNIVLERDKQGSLGFNIMGGYSVSSSRLRYMYIGTNITLSSIFSKSLMDSDRK